MTTGLTYSQYVTQLAELAVVAETDTNFLAILPMAITYAENRMCRDIDFLSTIQTNSTFSLFPNSRSVTVPPDTFVTLQQINVITPSGTTTPNSGTRNALLPTTKEWLDYVYSSNSNSDLPIYFAMLNQSTFLVGPWPDLTYTVELVGTYRPDSLSATNTSTFISLYLPDLFIMASMVYVSAFQRNFQSAGNTPDEPVMANSYEGQYGVLLKGAVVEEARKHFQSSGWTSMTPAVVASPTRG